MRLCLGNHGALPISVTDPKVLLAKPENKAPAQPGSRPAVLLPDHLNVMVVGFEADGKTLVSVSTERNVAIRRWDLETRKLKQEVTLAEVSHPNVLLNGHMLLSADCKRLVAIVDKEIRIWETATGKLVKNLPLPIDRMQGFTVPNAQGFIRGLTCTPDLSLIACGWTPGLSGIGSLDSYAIVWDVASGNVVQTVQHADAVQSTCVALSHDGKWLATGSQKAGTHVWEVSTGKRLLVLPNLEPGLQLPDPKVAAIAANQILCLSFSPDGKQLAIGDLFGVKLTDAKTGKLLHRIDAPFHSRRSGSGLVFSKDSQLLARIATEKTVPIWSTQTAMLIAELPTGAQGGSFSDDGRWFAIGFTDAKKGVAVWRLQIGAAAVMPSEPTADDIFARKISLSAKAMPLKDALAAVARAAQVELQLDGEALKHAGVDIEQPVTVSLTDEPLTDALARLVNWDKHLGAFRETRGGKLIITTIQARQADIERRLPDWLKPHYNRGLLATLDEDGNVVSITAGAIMSDELLAKLTTLPKLRELHMETTGLVTPAGLKVIANLASLQKASFFSINHDGKGLGDAIVQHVLGLKSLRELSLNDCDTTDAAVALLEGMPQLTHLSLYGEARLTDAAIASIAKLKALKQLSLDSYVGTKNGWMRFSKQATAALAGLRQLEHLHLVGQGISPEMLQHPQLKSLSVGGATVDDACAARIARLRHLQSLELAFANITDDGLRQIADLPELRRLDLNSHVVTDVGIGHLKRLPALQHLSLRASRLTDESLRHLAAIKSLRRVDLHGSGQPGVNMGKCFTIEGVQLLKALPNLRTLWLTNFQSPGGFLGLKELAQLHELTLTMANIPEAELQALEEALPNTRISSMSGGYSFPRLQKNQPRKSGG